jgi:general secretion pathway protein L
MPTLILYFSADFAANAVGNAQEVDYVLLRDDQQIASQGRAALALLPLAGRGTEVIAVLPARAVSWHLLSLPARVAASVLSPRAEPARARSVLVGALEEQLLDDPQQLHFAAFAGASADSPLWIAVCDRVALKATLQVLDAAGRTVTRIVAECEPVEAGAPAVAWVSGAMQPAQVALCTATGVALLPLGPVATALMQAQSSLELLAEPSVLGIAEQAFGGSVAAQTLPQRMVRAARSGRNIAQFEFMPSKTGRAFKQFAVQWQKLLHAPQWRPLRWGLAALLLTQVVALNAVAYRQKARIEQKRAEIQNVFTQTFPNVPVVVDAPLQMQREIGVLAQSRGASEVDPARLLTAIGNALGKVASKNSGNKSGSPGSLSAVDFTNGELRLKSDAMTDADARAVSAEIVPTGWVALLQGDQLLVRREGAQ